GTQAGRLAGVAANGRCQGILEVDVPERRMREVEPAVERGEHRQLPGDGRHRVAAVQRPEDDLPAGVAPGGEDVASTG
ncbi:hypothetical protein B4Q13_25135, partial [Lacticaseibacillus rhamnosus]